MKVLQCDAFRRQGLCPARGSRPWTEPDGCAARGGAARGEEQIARGSQTQGSGKATPWKEKRDAEHPPGFTRGQKRVTNSHGTRTVRCCVRRLPPRTRTPLCRRLLRAVTEKARPNPNPAPQRRRHGDKKPFSAPVDLVSQFTASALLPRVKEAAPRLPAGAALRPGSASAPRARHSLRAGRGGDTRPRKGEGAGKTKLKKRRKKKKKTQATSTPRLPVSSPGGAAVPPHACA